jgi:glycosyltransferase involved in cell wall biosynthesis/GT2 family glycosyltransferase
MTVLSTILISKNQAWNVNRLIESVARGTSALHDTQTILVDSASTDQTIALASQYPIEIIRLADTQRLTAALGRYVGYQRSTGEFVLFLDGDMELIPGWVDSALAVLNEHPNIGAVTGKLIDRLPTDVCSNALAHHAELTSAGGMADVPHGGGAAMYRREVLERVGSFDPRLYSDEEPELCLRIRKAGFRIVKLGHPIAFHYSEPSRRIATLLHRRRRNLYLGFGQNIRHHWGDNLLLPYISERGFGLPPALMFLTALSVSSFAFLTARVRWLRAVAGVGAGLVGLDIIKRRSVYDSLYAFLQRTIIFEGTLRGIALSPSPAGNTAAQYEVIKGVTQERQDIGQADVGVSAHAPILNKPRVLVVGPVFRGKQAGGIEMFNEILLSSYLTDEFEILHLDTTRTEAGEGKAGSLAVVNFYYFSRQILELLFILITRRPAVMHQPVTDRIGFWKEGVFMLLGRLCGVRVIGHVHGCMFKELFEGKNRLVRWGIAGVLKLPNVIIALSDGWRSFMVDQIDPSLSVVVVPNTVDASFARLAHQDAHTHSDESLTVLYMGSLHKRKGVLDAMQAVEHVRESAPSARFVFAGGIKQESERVEIERARDELAKRGNVCFPGIVTGQKKLDLFAEASIFILPSYYENFPIVVLEALAAGLPLVVTPVGALPEVLRDGENCFFVDAGDVEGLADRIIYLIEHPEVRTAMSAANRELFCRQFDQPAILRQIARVYYDLAGGN